MNEFYIVDNYGFKEDYLDQLINNALSSLGIKEANFSIIFVNDKEIKKINKEYRKIDKPTDVITFALNDNLNIKLPYEILGDIYISIDRVKDQAKTYGHSQKRELSFLAIHGLLHLLGYSHDSKEDEKIMFKLQEEILTENGITR